MRRFTALLTALLITLTAFPAGASHDDGPAAFAELRELQERADRQFARMQRNLNEMERLAEQLPPCDVRDELLHRIDKSKRMGRRMARTTDDLVALASQPTYAEPLLLPEPMSEQEYARISGALQREWWDDSRQQLLAEIARDRFFSSKQVARVMGLFTFGDAKVTAAATLYPNVIDPENFYTVYDQLTFRSEKDDLRRRIAR